MSDNKNGDTFRFSAERAITGFAGAVILAICLYVGNLVSDLGVRVARLEEGTMFVKYRLDRIESQR